MDPNEGRVTRSSPTFFFSLASSASVGYKSRVTHVSMCISHCTFGELCVSGEER